jgi:hypothetical protein
VRGVGMGGERRDRYPAGEPDVTGRHRVRPAGGIDAAVAGTEHQAQRRNGHGFRLLDGSLLLIPSRLAGM